MVTTSIADRLGPLLTSSSLLIDDDGSGTTTIMEVLHSLVENSFVPTNSSVELHVCLHSFVVIRNRLQADLRSSLQWYSAEEGGLLGSAQVANAYHSAGTPVKAVRLAYLALFALADVMFRCFKWIVSLYAALQLAVANPAQ